MLPSQSSILALDFDGVLWDSARECYVLGSEVWRDLGLPPLHLSYERFYSGRWLVRAGREFGALLSLLNDNDALDVQAYTPEQFANYVRALGNWIDEFGRAFAARRAFYRRERPEYWCSLQRPFPAVQRCLPLWQERFRAIAVCTTKDATSTRFLLHYLGWDLPVYGVEVGTDKSRHMQLLIDAYRVQPSQIHFIDDLLVNVQDAAQTGINGYLASWGYNTPHCHRRAQELGFRVLSPADLENLGCF